MFENLELTCHLTSFHDEFIVAPSGWKPPDADAASVCRESTQILQDRETCSQSMQAPLTLKVKPLLISTYTFDTNIRWNEIAIYSVRFDVKSTWFDSLLCHFALLCTPSMLGDMDVPPFWPPFLTFWGLNSIFWGYFFSSANTKTIFWGIKTTNSYRIPSFRPQISFFPLSFWVQVSAASGTPPSVFGPSTPPPGWWVAFLDGECLNYDVPETAL